jgi:hypothetical protein
VTVRSGSAVDFLGPNLALARWLWASKSTSPTPTVLFGTWGDLVTAPTFWDFCKV